MNDSLSLTCLKFCFKSRAILPNQNFLGSFTRPRRGNLVDTNGQADSLLQEADCEDLGHPRHAKNSVARDSSNILSLTACSRDSQITPKPQMM